MFKFVVERISDLAISDCGRNPDIRCRPAKKS